MKPDLFIFNTQTDYCGNKQKKADLHLIYVSDSLHLMLVRDFFFFSLLEMLELSQT